jgi:hypothetical protein
MSVLKGDDALAANAVVHPSCSNLFPSENEPRNDD